MTGTIGSIGASTEPPHADRSSATSASVGFIGILDILPRGSSLFTARQQALTTVVPPAIRCHPSAASRDGSQLALDGVEP